MTDVQALKADLDAAEAAKETLVEQRRSKRYSLSRIKWREYNESTRTKQKDVQAAVDAAQQAFSEALGRVRSDAVEVALGTITETEGGADG